jgi:hypothetical protein
MGPVTESEWREKYETACVAEHEARERLEAFELSRVQGHPRGCQCDKCFDKSKAEDTASAALDRARTDARAANLHWLDARKRYSTAN